MTMIRLIKRRDRLIFLNDILGIPLDELSTAMKVSPSFLSHVKAGNRQLNSAHKKRLKLTLDQVLDEMDRAEPDNGLVTALIEYGESL